LGDRLEKIANSHIVLMKITRYRGK